MGVINHARQQSENRQIIGTSKFEQTGFGKGREKRYAQVKELVEHRVQGLQFHLRALTLGQREEVVGTELHDDERVAQTFKGTGQVRGAEAFER